MQTRLPASPSRLQMRRSFHSLMRDEAVQVVEVMTARKVVTVLFDVDPERSVAAQLFVLDRRADTGVAVTADSDGHKSA
jgi:hypothetical protein